MNYVLNIRLIKSFADLLTVKSSSTCIGSLSVHGCDERPLVGAMVEPLCCILPVMAVVASHRVYRLTQNCHRYVATPCVHWSHLQNCRFKTVFKTINISQLRSYLSPGFRHSIEAATGVEIVHAVKATDNIDAVSKYRCAVVCSRSSWIHFFYLMESLLSYW